MKLSTNEVTLIGFVGGDTQSKETKNHNKYAVVSMATTESWKDKNGDWQRRTTWHRLCSATSLNTQLLAPWAHISRLRANSTSANIPPKDGVKKSISEIWVQRINCLNLRPSGR